MKKTSLLKKHEKLNNENNLDICITEFEKVEYIGKIYFKPKVFSFSTQRTRATKTLEIIHTGICQIEKNTYFYNLTCLNEFTCLKQIHLLLTKWKTAEIMKMEFA